MGLTETQRLKQTLRHGRLRGTFVTRGRCSTSASTLNPMVEFLTSALPPPQMTSRQTMRKPLSLHALWLRWDPQTAPCALTHSDGSHTHTHTHVLTHTRFGRIRLHRKQPQICGWCASNRTDLVKQTTNFHCKQWRLTEHGSVSFGWVQTQPEICGAIEYALCRAACMVSADKTFWAKP